MARLTLRAEDYSEHPDNPDGRPASRYAQTVA
jgi:hypothetical protein